jgi:hypothetical protein
LATEEEEEEEETEDRSRLLGGFIQNKCSERGGRWARLRDAAYVETAGGGGGYLGGRLEWVLI